MSTPTKRGPGQPKKEPTKLVRAYAADLPALAKFGPTQAAAIRTLLGLQAPSLAQQLHDLRPGHGTPRQTFGRVSTYFEKSADGQTIRLIRETAGGPGAAFLSQSEIVRTVPA
jgi:hypothetical protein